MLGEKKRLKKKKKKGGNYAIKQIINYRNITSNKHSKKSNKNKKIKEK